VKRGVPELDTEFKKLAQLITISKHQANKENHSYKISYSLTIDVHIKGFVQ